MNFYSNFLSDFGFDYVVQNDNYMYVHTLLDTHTQKKDSPRRYKLNLSQIYMHTGFY